MWGSSASLKFLMPGMGKPSPSPSDAKAKITKITSGGTIRTAISPPTERSTTKRSKASETPSGGETERFLLRPEDPAVAAALTRDGIHVESLSSTQVALVGDLTSFSNIPGASDVIHIAHCATTPIQRSTVPLGLAGYNVLGLAPTGSGKTLAYIVPAILTCARTTTCCLVLLPTRVLAMQVHIVVSGLLEGSAVPALCCVGGQADDTQQLDDVAAFLQSSSDGPSVLMATPGRLYTLLKKKTPIRGALRDFLARRLGVLVLDEVDRLYDMGSSDHLLTVLGHIPPTVQRLYYSATLPPQIERDLMDEAFRQRAVKVAVGTTHVPCESITQQFVLVKSDAHRDATLVVVLQRCLSDDATSKVIVFCGSIENTKHASEMARKASPILRNTCRVLHSDVPQEERVKAFESFYTDPAVRILLATDVASRGLDVSGVDCVVNYRFPRSLVDYIHRAGRTGRAGREGLVCSLLGHEDHRTVPELAAMLGAQGVAVPSDLVAICEQQRLKKRPKT